MTGFKIPIATETENPRWTRCRHAIGREPKGWEFIIWVGRCWHEFYRHLGVRNYDEARNAVGVNAVHDAFDRFQDEGVSAGRWTSPDGHLPPLSEAESASP